MNNSGRFVLIRFCLGLALAMVAARAADDTDKYQTVEALFAKHCLDCHATQVQRVSLFSKHSMGSKKEAKAVPRLFPDAARKVS